MFAIKAETGDTYIIRTMAEDVCEGDLVNVHSPSGEIVQRRVEKIKFGSSRVAHVTLRKEDAGARSFYDLCFFEEEFDAE